MFKFKTKKWTKMDTFGPYQKMKKKSLIHFSEFISIDYDDFLFVWYLIHSNVILILHQDFIYVRYRL